MKIAFTGHRPNKLGGYDETKNLKIAIQKEVYKIILKEDKEPLFIVGMALGVDMWMAELAVRTNIPFHAYIPFSGQESIWPSTSQVTYKALLEEASLVKICCEGSYESWKMQKRNEMMVNDCDMLIAIYDRTKGGTQNCVNYAIKMNKTIKIINPKKIIESEEKVSDKDKEIAKKTFNTLIEDVI